MEREPQPRGRKKDRTGVFISAALHALIIGVIAYFVSKTEFGQMILEHTIGGRRIRETQEKAKPPPAQARPKESLKPPPGAPPPARRAADAPAAVDESFFTQERGKGKDEAGARVIDKAPTVVQAPVFRPPPRVSAAAPSSIKELMAERAKASAVVESFGTEQISKSGVSDVGDIVARISGATVAEGKFAVVRGLADRYTLSTLNGADIPSADPDRRAVQLDLFPAQFLSRVDVSKTFQPDQPGGFAGGLINIVTRTFPERPLFSFSVGTSYNTQASLRDDFLFNDQGSLDWLAMDDGTRELPAEAEATNPVGTSFPVDSRIKDTFASRQFAPIPGDSPLNSSMSMAFGDTTHFLGRPLGILVGINHKIDYSHYDNGFVANKYNPIEDDFDDEFDLDVKSVVEYTWGSLATLSYQVSDNHELNFNFMFVQTGEDEARHLRGQSASQSTQEGSSYADRSILHWTERSLTYFQLKGGHVFPELNDVRLDWVGSLATTTQDEPDHRIFLFKVEQGDPNNPNDDTAFLGGAGKPQYPTRIFRELQEDNASFRMDLTIPVSPNGGRDNTLKTGMYISKSEQTYDSRAWEVRAVFGHPFLRPGGFDPNIYLIRPNEPYYEYWNFPANFKYTGEQTIEAAYAMGTVAPLDWLRLVGGVRYETTELTVDTVNVTKADESFSAAIEQKDLLPAFTATALLRSNLQVRAAWSETISRPTYREISAAEIYDVARGRTISGNPLLTMSASENYDLRLEWFPRPGELISVGAFYKKIDSPIELSQRDTSGEVIFYTNYSKADVFGIELELRKNFRGFWGMPYDQFSLGFNYAYIKSEVPRTFEQRQNQQQLVGKTSEKRPLYDQPEYVLNSDLTWDCFASGTSITLSGGVVGPRLVLVGYATPDEYEEPAPQLEFSISQRIGRHWKVRFSGKNLLDPVYEVTQDWAPRKGNLVMESYTRGMQFGLSIGCDF